MKLVIVSHKQLWRVGFGGPPRFAANGGFPTQVRALSELFDETQLVVPIAPPPPPASATIISGHRIGFAALEPLPLGRQRRRRRITWLPRNGPLIWRAILEADAVHAPIPGDVGTFGILATLAQRKPLFVRHCGDWWRRDSLGRRAWPWLMETIAGGRNVMLATGAYRTPPSRRNPVIHWTFATRLSAAELEACRPRQPRRPRPAPRLLVVGRQVAEKGTAIVIESLPLLLDRHPYLHLDVCGDGPALGQLKEQVVALGIQHCVTFHGHVPPGRVIELMHQADLLCLPSASEGFGKAVVEAMACGLPVIATAVPSELIRDSGMLLPERTPQALAEAVLASLSDHERYAAMSANAASAAQPYSCENWRDQIRHELEAAWGPLRRA